MRACLVLILLGAALGTRSQNPPARMNVAILLFDDVQIIDYTGPYEVLAGIGALNVFTVAEKRDTIHTIFEMKVIPDYDFTNHPAVDILIVPGGGGARTRNPGPFEHYLPATETAQLMAWVKQNASSAKHVLSVCNGAFILARAGLLDNLPATCTAPLISRLQEVSPSITPVYDKRFVDTGKIITSAGLSSGIDASLHLVEKMFGRGVAQQRALMLEYPWDPDGDWARAALADKYMMFRYDGIKAKSLSRQGDRTQWESKWLVTAEDSKEADRVMDVVNKALSNGTTFGNGFKPVWRKMSGSDRSSEWSFEDEQKNRWQGKVELAASTAKDYVLTVSVKKK